MAKNINSTGSSTPTGILYPMGTGSYYIIRHLPRQVSHQLSPQVIGIEPDLTRSDDRLFDQIGVCFIIKGSATCYEDDRGWRMEGPCVIFQWPGHRYRHTPDTSWEAFYFTYHEKYLPYFRTGAWVDFHGTHVILKDPEHWRSISLKLNALCQQVGHFGIIDRIDYFCEQLLLEVLIANRMGTRQGIVEKLEGAKDWLVANYAEQVDIDRIATQFDIAPRTFSRHWQQQFGMTPIAYLTELRMDRARDLLLAGNMSVHQIARHVGFEDPFYFSRRFQKTFGQSPSQFRTYSKP